MLTLTGVGKSFGEINALLQVDLEIESGQIIGLVGGNGAGKTTLLRLMAGVMKPTTGSVIFKDMPVDELDKFVEKRNRKQTSCEYLWSHPKFTKGGNRQTNQPIVIQQDRAFLTELRENKSGS